MHCKALALLHTIALPSSPVALPVLRQKRHLAMVSGEARIADIVGSIGIAFGLHAPPPRTLESLGTNYS